MKDITIELRAAQSYIRRSVLSHQVTPETAVRYVYENILLPPALRVSLIEFGYRILKNN